MADIQNKHSNQSGFALFTCIVALLILSMAVLSNSNAAVMEQKMAANMHLASQCLHSGESAARVAASDTEAIQNSFNGDQTREYALIAPSANSDPSSVVVSYYASTHPTGFSANADIVEHHFKMHATADNTGGTVCNLNIGFQRVSPSGIYTMNM